jgi:sulfite reductase beta subunit-like hemoprotein
MEMKDTFIDFSRFIGRFSIGRDSHPLNITGSPHFLRVKVPRGFITSDQLDKIAELTQVYSRGKAEITNRQCIQLHWIEAEESPVLFDELDRLGFTTDMCGQGFSGARLGDVRNIVCCPSSGIGEHEVVDGSDLVLRLTEFFVGNVDFLDMPRKLKISISGCGCDCTRAWINDLAFVGVKKEGQVGYTVLVGGSSGNSLPGPRLAKPSGLFVYPEQVFDFVVAVAETHRDFGNRESKSKARLKWLIDERGLSWFLGRVTEKVGTEFEKYDGPVFTGNGDHSGTGRQSQRSLHLVNVPLVDGRLTSLQMNRLAEFSRRYGTGELRLTPTQNIMIPNVVEVDSLLHSLQDDFNVRGPALKWTSLACSSDFCGRSLEPHSKQLLKDLVEHLDSRFHPRVLDEAGIRIHISGCPNNCCPPNTVEIGLSGKQVIVGEKLRQFYDILLGGSLGVSPSFSRLVMKKSAPYEIKHCLASLIEYYLVNKEQGELFKDFCNRSQDVDLLNHLKYKEVK